MSLKARLAGTLCLLLLLLLPPALAQEAQMIRVPFVDPDGVTMYACDFPYSDAFFPSDAGDYSHPLAQASLGLAFSAFRPAKGYAGAQDGYIRDFLTQAGFDRLQSTDYDRQPAIDTLATCMGSKEIGEGENRFTLIAVGICGQGYDREWCSNFSIGDSIEHEGFAAAAELISARVKDYVAQHALSGDVRLWITGYSRAAGVANLAAVRLAGDDSLSLRAVYGYTFATPNTTRAPQALSSLFNIVGQFDPVPSMPFHIWGYDRNGTTLYLPALEVNPDFAQRFDKADAVYRTVTGEAFFASPEANWLMHKILEFLAAFIPSAADYSAHYQNLLVNTYNANDSVLNIITTLAQELVSDPKALSELGEERAALLTLLADAANSTLYDIIGWHSTNWAHTESIAKSIMHEHYPQVYMAWMLSADTQEALFSASTAYRRAGILGSVDLDILDAESGLVVASVDGSRITAEDNSGVTVLYIGDELLITLPESRAYILSMTATEHGKLDYTIREHRSGYVSSRTIKYPVQTVKAGQQFESTLGLGIEQAYQDSMFTAVGGEPIVPIQDTLGQDHAVQVMALAGEEKSSSPMPFVAWAAGLMLLFIVINRRGKKGASKGGSSSKNRS